jgi:hypothetical protein
MKEPTLREVAALQSAPAGKRLKYFVTQVADRDCAWMLVDADGRLCLMSGDSGDALPLWPAEAFALACASLVAPEANVTSVALGDLMNSLLPSLAMNAIGVAVLLSPDGTSAVVPARKLRGLLAEYVEENFSEQY